MKNEQPRSLGDLRCLLPGLLALILLFLPMGSRSQTSSAGDLQYRVHVEGYGWLPWVANGSITGTVGEKRRIEAIEIRSQYAVVKYQAFVQRDGWTQEARNGEMVGTTGQNKRMEAIWLWSSKGNLKYRGHMEKLGWGAWVKAGKICGNPDEGLRLEAIEILLERGMDNPTLRISPSSKPSLSIANRFEGNQNVIGGAEKKRLDYLIANNGGLAQEVTLTLSSNKTIPGLLVDAGEGFKPCESGELREVPVGAIESGDSARVPITLLAKVDMAEDSVEFTAEVEGSGIPTSSRTLLVHTLKGFGRGLPPIMFADLSFADGNGNGILEALESSTLKLNVRNEGKGVGQGLEITVSDDSEDPSLHIGSGSIRFLKPGESRVVTIPINAEVNLKTAEHKLQINITEHFGYDMDPAFLVLNTREYAKPSLVFSGLEVVDNGQGTMSILEDGKLQAGEQAKVRVVIQNVGLGKAEGVKYTLSSQDENVYLEGGSGDLGNLDAGQTGEFWFVISPNKRVQGGKRLPVYLAVTENVGRGNLDYYPLPIQLDQRPPKVETVTIKPNLESLKKQIARFEFTSKKFTANVGSLINVKSVEASKTKRKNSVAVVFGVENYNELVSAPYAANDAELMKEYFEKRLGVEKVVLYKNAEVSGFVFDDVFNPDNGELQKAIVKGETELFVYYSGHGLPNKSGQETYLFPADGKVSRLEAQGYSLTKFYESLSKLGARSVTVILDACFSGGSRATTKTKTENLVAMKGVSLKINKPWLLYKNFTVINSSTGEETSLGYDDAQTGLFTYYLAAGLQGKADANNDGRVTLGELKNYVTNNVMETSRKISGLQTPEFYGDESKVLVEY